MEIVDAMTVAGRADVVHWTEKDEDEMKGLYWRQTFNFVTQKLSVRGSAPDTRLPVHLTLSNS